VTLQKKLHFELLLCSLFAKEDKSNVSIPDLCNEIRSTDRLEDIIIKPETIAAELEKLRSDKAAGYDNLSPRLLKASSAELAVPVSMIFRKSIDKCCVPRDWVGSMSLQSTKRKKNVNPKITAQSALLVRYVKWWNLCSETNW